MKKLTLLGAVALVSGCAGGMEITTPPVDMNFTSQQAAATITNYSPVAVRTWLQSDGNKSELQNVPCTLTGNGFKADFLTPAKVNLPAYLGNTKPVTVTCTYDARRVSVVADPYNKTMDNNYGAAQLGFGLIGVLVTAAANSNRDTSNDTFIYRDIDVVFE